MGKKSKRAGRNKPKRTDDEIYLAGLDLPIPLSLDAATPPHDKRQLADYCLENFPLLDKQGEMRFALFPQYLSFLPEVFIGDTEENISCKRHTKFLRKIANDEDDLTYFRVESLHALSARYCKKRDPEGMLDCLENIPRLCENASEIEKSRRIPTGVLVGERLSEQQRRAEDAIDNFYNRKSITVFRSSTEIVEVPATAGNQCDNCQKTKKELNVHQFCCCTRCKFEYYCCKECQRAAWKNGHKQRCRTKGEFRVGDQTIVDRNFKHQVTLVEYLTKEDSWVVVDIEGTNQRTVPTQNLTRLRPALWQCPETYKRHFGTG